MMASRYVDILQMVRIISFVGESSNQPRTKD